MDAINSDTLRLDSRTLNATASPLDLQRVLSSLRRHLRLFIGIALTVMILVALVTLTSPPRYASTATVLINEHTADVLNLKALEARTQDVGVDSSAVDTQVEILRSRALASRVVDQLNLDADPEFNGDLRPPGRFDFLKRLIGAGATGPATTPAGKQREHENVVNAVLGDLLVKRAGVAYTVNLVVTTLNPNTSTAIANAFAQRYLTEGLDAKIDESKNATSWLDGRLAQLRQQAETADAAVEQYKIANNLLSAQGATLTEQEISNLDVQLATARAQDAEQDAKLKTAQKQLAAGSNGGDVGEAISAPVIVSLRAQHAQASAHLADIQTRYGERHPEMIQARRSLADIDAQIQVQIERIISNLKAQSQVAHTRTESLAATADQSRGSLANNNRATVQLDDLQRNADAAKVLYEALLSRYKELTAREGNQQSDAQIVSPAQLPTAPSFPNKKLDLLLAIVLGLVAGSAAVLTAALLQRGVSNATEVENAFDLPDLGDIPTLTSTLEGAVRQRRLDPVRYVVDKPLSRFAEAFRNLRTSILSSRTGHQVKIIAVTSSLPNEGKTTTTLCLGRTMAMAGANVVVVDCDLRQRSINKSLTSEPQAGLLEVLNGTSTLDQVLVRDEDTGGFILPLAKSSFTPKDVFGSAAMTQLLDQLRARFDVVLLDTAPVLAVADTRVLCPQADAVVFLTKWRKTSRKAALTALRALSSSDIFIAGVTLTQVNVREQARAGEGAAHYYRAYRKYYTG